MNNEKLLIHLPYFPEKMEPTRQKFILAGILFFVVLWGLIMTLSTPGIAWDEPYYLTTGSHYILPWFKRIGTDAFTQEAVADAWYPIDRHPPLAQICIGITKQLGQHWLGPVLAGRIAPAIIFSFLTAGLFLFVSKYYGNLAGIFSAICLVGMPRVWGHAHFATIEIFITTCWFAVVALFTLILDLRKRWWPITGIVMGLGLLTKLTIAPLPLLLITWCFFIKNKKGWHPLIAFLPCILIFFLWPWMWFDTWAHLKEYFGVVRDRAQISVYYFGAQYDLFDVPWHYPLVTTLSTTPVLITIAAIFGVWQIGRKKKEDAVGLLILMNVLFLLFISSLPGIPKYDGVRLFLPLFPFLAALSGIGIACLYKYLIGNVKRGKWIARIGLVSLVVYHIGCLIVIEPFYLSYYSGMIGGGTGANRIGMESTYWLEALESETIQFINENAPAGSRIAIYPNADLLRLFHGDLQTFREDLTLVDRARGDPWDFQILICRQGMFDEMAWHLYRNENPIWERSLSGVPLCMVFRRKDLNKDYGE